MFSIQFHSCNWTTPPTGADDTHSGSHWWQTLCPSLRTSPVQCAASCLCTGWWETGRTTALMRAVNWGRLGYELKGHNGSPRMGRKKPRRQQQVSLYHSRHSARCFQHGGDLWSAAGGRGRRRCFFWPRCLDYGAECELQSCMSCIYYVKRDLKKQLSLFLSESIQSGTTFRNLYQEIKSCTFKIIYTKPGLTFNLCEHIIVSWVTLMLSVTSSYDYLHHTIM